MKRIILVLLLPVLLSCNNESPIKEELKEALNMAGIGAYVEIQNSNLLSKDVTFHVLTRFLIQENGVELDVAPVRDRITPVSDAQKISLAYSNIKLAYHHELKFDSGYKVREIVIVLK